MERLDMLKKIIPLDVAAHSSLRHETACSTKSKTQPYLPPGLVSLNRRRLDKILIRERVVVVFVGLGGSLHRGPGRPRGTCTGAGGCRRGLRVGTRGLVRGVDAEP